MKTKSLKRKLKAQPTVALEPVGLVCPGCQSTSEPVDICGRCGNPFGDLCKTDKNGYNCTCQYCGNNTYNTQCPDCDRSIHAADEYALNEQAQPRAGHH